MSLMFYSITKLLKSKSVNKNISLLPMGFTHEMNIFQKKNYLFLSYDKKFLQKCVIVDKEIYVQSSDTIASTWCLKQIHVAPFNTNGSWG